jgi:hypothetical protein
MNKFILLCARFSLSLHKIRCTSEEEMNEFISFSARFSLSLHPMMRRLYFTALLLALWCTAAWAQDDDSAGKVKFPGGKCWLYRITLSDKNGTPYQIDHPEVFLSQKAIDRRIRQGLAIDSTDLPLPPAYLEQISATGAEIKCLSKWNRTVLVRVKNNKILHAVERLPFVAGTMKLWTSPDSVKPPVRSFMRIMSNTSIPIVLHSYAVQNQATAVNTAARTSALFFCSIP